MKSILNLFLALVAAQGLSNTDIVVSPTAGTVSVRRYSIKNRTSSTGVVDRLLVTGTALDVNTLAQSGTLETAAFGCQTAGAQSSDSVGFYFGLLNAQGTYDVTNGQLATAYSGSLVEVAASFEGMAAYLDKDGEPGFQFYSDIDHWSCKVSDSDCLPSYSSGGLKKFEDMTWNPIKVSNASCGTAANALQGCTVWTFTLSTTDNSVQFDMHLTTQPVTIKGVTVTPDDAKLDVKLQYPWTLAPSECGGNCKLVLVVISGGKVTTGSGQGVYSAVGTEGKGHSTFKTDTGKATYFSWDTAAKQGSGAVADTSTTVYTDVVTSADVEAQHEECTSPRYLLEHATACAVNEVWNTVSSAYHAFGWDLRLHFFSLNEVQPATVFWDPAVGSIDCTANPDSPLCQDGASALLVGLLFLAFV